MVAGKLIDSIPSSLGYIPFSKRPVLLSVYKPQSIALFPVWIKHQCGLYFLCSHSPSSACLKMREAIMCNFFCLTVLPISQKSKTSYIFPIFDDNLHHIIKNNWGRRDGRLPDGKGCIISIFEKAFVMLIRASVIKGKTV